MFISKEMTADFQVRSTFLFTTKILGLCSVTVLSLKRIYIFKGPILVQMAI